MPRAKPIQKTPRAAARRLAAEWCAVMVFRGRETDSYQTTRAKDSPDAAEHTSLVRYARELGKEIEMQPLAPDSGGVTETKRSKVAVFVPITASDAESLGAICLICEKKPL